MNVTNMCLGIDLRVLAVYLLSLFLVDVFQISINGIEICL